MHLRDVHWLSWEQMSPGLPLVLGMPRLVLDVPSPETQ
jgi:hypothetical protein